MNKERKLNPPFRWAAPPMTKVELSAIRVVDAEAGLRMELFTPAPNGERLVQGIDVPFMPTAMHADCLSTKNHEREMAKAVEEAVTAAKTGLEEKLAVVEEEVKILFEEREQRSTETKAAIAALEERNTALLAEAEQLRRQFGAMSGVLGVAKTIDDNNFLFATRPAFAHTLRLLLKQYADGNYPGFVSETTHKEALARAEVDQKAAVDGAIRETTKKMRTAFEIASRRLSSINAQHPELDVRQALRAIEQVFAPTDGI